MCPPREAWALFCDGVRRRPSNCRRCPAFQEAHSPKRAIDELQAAGIDYDSAEASFIPSMEVPLDIDGARRMLRVIEALEDSDDVQNVYANGAISDEILAQLDEE